MFLPFNAYHRQNKYALSNPHAKSQFLYTMILEVEHITNHEIKKKSTTMMTKYIPSCSSLFDA